MGEPWYLQTEVGMVLVNLVICGVIGLLALWIRDLQKRIAHLEEERSSVHASTPTTQR
jgi:hypothetical protein